MSIPYLSSSKDYDLENFLKIHNFHISQNLVSNPDIIFIGDSITQLIDKDIFKNEYSKYNALNFGICSDNTSHVLYRLENGLLDNIKPKLVVLLIGVNNWGCNPNDVAKGILNIINTIRIKLPNTIILNIQLLPFNESPFSNERKYINDVNNIIKNFNNNKTVHSIDISLNFTKSDGFIDSYIMPDFLHLSIKGYTIFVDCIRDKIDFLIKNHDNLII